MEKHFLLYPLNIANLYTPQVFKLYILSMLYF